MSPSKSLLPKTENKSSDLAPKAKIQSIRTVPEVTNALVMSKFNVSYDDNETDTLLPIVKDLVELNKSLASSNKGRTKHDMERMLMSQVQSLNSIFCNLAIRAQDQEYMKHMESFMRLALKAQSQCRATIETLAMVKSPPVYANTANIAHNQQINNGALPPDRDSPNQQHQSVKLTKRGIQ